MSAGASAASGRVLAMAVAVAAVSAAASACTPHPRSSPDPATACDTGTVATTGTEVDLRVLLRTEDGRDLWMAGEDLTDLMSLTGAVVEVCGARVTDMGRDGLEVERWTLRSVDGMDARAGVLREEDGDWLLADTVAAGAGVPLAEVPDGLRALTGRRVWAAGVWVDGRLAVRSFGRVGRPWPYGAVGGMSVARERHHPGRATEPGSARRSAP